MSDIEDSVSNECSHTLTYLNWYDHIWKMALAQWKSFTLYSIGGFSLFLMFIEVSNKFFPQLIVNTHRILIAGVAISFLSALLKSIHHYKNTVPLGLEGETAEIQKIARDQKPFWEYELAFHLLKERINDTNQRIDDLLNNRIHVQVTKIATTLDYLEWIKTRPENLIRLVDAAKQLLIFDLIEAIDTTNDDGLDIANLVRVIDLIDDLYNEVYKFEVNGKSIGVPDNFKLIHEIQAEWVRVVQKGICDILEILETISKRSPSDREPIEAGIVFDEPPRIDEFSSELERLEAMLPAILAEEVL